MDVKGFAKKGLRPVINRINHQIDRRIDFRTTDLVQRIHDFEFTRDNFPAFVNAIASQNAASRQVGRRLNSLEAGMGSVERRGEVIREELLYELRYGGQREDKITPEVEVAILSPDKLAAMGDNIRLNLGAGHIPEPGYLNVDFRAVPGIDITADIRHLPFSPGELAEIRSAHLLEHFPLEELRRSILPTWVELLKDGGLFVAVVPDMASMVRAAAEGNIPMADFLKVTYGGQEYEGDFHFTGFTPESMRELFEDVGLTEVVVREQGRPNGMCLEMEIAATRRLAS